MVRIVSVSLLLLAPLLMTPLLITGPAAAQAGHGPGFVASFATPTPATGKIARWEDGVCPRTVGQRPPSPDRDPAGEGPCGFCRRAVNESPDCTPNIEIVFTASLPSVLDNVREA